MQGYSSFGACWRIGARSFLLRDLSIYCTSAASEAARDAPCGQHVGHQKIRQLYRRFRVPCIGTDADIEVADIVEKWERPLGFAAQIGEADAGKE